MQDADLIPGLRRSPVEGNGNPLQYSCLENPMGWGRATVHRVAKSWTWLRQLSMHVHPISWRPWEWKLRFLREDIPIAGIWNAWFSRLPGWTADFRFLNSSVPTRQLCERTWEGSERGERQKQRWRKTKPEMEKERMGSMSLIQKQS